MTNTNTPKKTGIRRLFWDIETSPNVVFCWRAGMDNNISHDNILHERKIICIGYMWEGDKKASVLRWDKDQDDKAMLERFLLVANEADELVAHYGDRFDLPWLRTRCLYHGLPPLPKYKTIDTKAWASKHFYFNSNKLDYIGSFLGFGHKLDTHFDLWKKIVLQKCGRSLDYMCKYCGRDVELLAKVYEKLRLHVAAKTHAGVALGNEPWTCSHCGSEDVKKSKTVYSAAGTVKHQMRCNSCHGYYSISETAKKGYDESMKKKKKNGSCK
jgi:hypothetical protein